VRGKLFVTLSFVMPLHLFEGFANERTTWLKHLPTDGASEALKTWVLNPNQLGRHRRIIIKEALSVKTVT
jgi:hypothetical protein